MIALRCLAALIGSFAASLAAAEPLLELCLLVGAPGESTYADTFARAADGWTAAAARGNAAATEIGSQPSAEVSHDRDRFREWIQARAGTEGPPVWIVYVGHGTFDGREARLNLRGPDVTATELAEWLRPVRRDLVFVHGGSAGAPFLRALSGPGRIIVSATRSGHEVNYARFGERLARLIADPAADIDQDGQTSLLEAFVTTGRQVQDFYAENARLATEHALIDDNGDGQGTPADWFRGTRSIRRSDTGAAADGERARLIALVPNADEQRLGPAERERRDRLEQELADLRQRQTTLPSAEYDRELERILRQLGALYRGDS